MKKIIFLFSMLVLTFLFQQCGGDGEANCSQKLKTDCVCTKEYDPVCGCDKTTYENPCIAECNSITEYTSGPCVSITGQTIFANWAYIGTISQGADTSAAAVKKHNYDVNLDFNDDLNFGKYSYTGKSSVNTYAGKFALNNSVLTFSENIMTEIGGNATDAAFEKDYLAMLYGKLTYRINTDRLLIITSLANGKTEELVFKKII